MRNASRFLAVLGVAVVVVAAATPASATCAPPKSASSFTAAVDNYVYFDLGNNVTAAQTVGQYYDADDPTVNNGTYSSSQWLFQDVSGKLSMQANLGAAGTNGCPDGLLILRIQTASATGVRFLTATATEGIRNPGGADFDFSFGKAPGTIIPAGTLPRPRVQTSGRAGTNVNLNVALDAAGGNSAGGAASAVTGYDILRASGADPGRNPAGWTLVQTVTTADGAPIPSIPLVADCSNPAVDQFFATRANFGTAKSDLVSDSTRVNCNPSLAEPRFNVVPKKPTGPKKNGTRQ